MGEDILVAPIVETSQNETSRKVWVPPGDWEDAWDGSVVTGPQTIEVRRPYEQIPMWHRRGSFLILSPEPTFPIDDQDWSKLVLEVFPAFSGFSRRSLFERRTSQRTDLELNCSHTSLSLFIGAAMPRA